MLMRMMLKNRDRNFKRKIEGIWVFCRFDVADETHEGRIPSLGFGRLDPGVPRSLLASLKTARLPDRPVPKP